MRWWLAVVLLACTAGGCGFFRSGPAITGEPGATQEGIASWYGPGFHGRRTASGEIYDQYALTAAHRTLPHGTRVRVTSLDSGRSVVVRINDRGPYIDGRIIDLSYTAAQQIALIGPGIAPVRVEVLAPGERDLPPAAVQVAAVPPAARPPAPPPAAPPVRAAALPPPPAAPAEPDAVAARPPAAWAVRAGAYTDYAAARRAQARLEPAVGGVRLALVDGPDGERHYQLRVGPFASAEDARSVARRLLALGMPALVVARGAAR